MDYVDELDDTERRGCMVMNIAHRGFSGAYPENTLLAFVKALEAGCDGIEFDVHLTKDDVPVIIHDEMVDRTTNGKGLVREYTYEQLRQLDASAEFVGKYGINGIPTLREYFELIKGRDVLSNIELKTGTIWYEGIEEKVLDMVDEFDRRKSVLLSSFNHLSILKCQELAPDLALGFLEESRLIDPAGYVKTYGIGYYHPLCYNMTPDVVAQLKKNNVKIMVWNANDQQSMLEMLKQDVDGVINNFPDQFGILRENYGKRG